MKEKTSLMQNSISRSPLRHASLVVALLLACFALSPQARATCQEGCLTNNNTVLGDDALLNLTTGTDNTALGFNALLSNTTGYRNTALGSQALTSNTTGVNNVAIGWQTLFSNEDGTSNVAIGYQALYQNTSGHSNIAIGDLALNANTGSANIAIGEFTGADNTTGNTNTAVGFNTFSRNTTGSGNCAFGNDALNSNSGGSNNTAIGVGALLESLGDNNIGIGYVAGQYILAGSNNIEIGAMGRPGDDGDIRIGTKGVHTAVHIAGIYGRTLPNGVTVVTDNLGHLGTVTSSARFKEAIQRMDKASEAILALKPVTFRYKHELDPNGIPQFGLVAEEVEKVNPDLVARDEQGKPYTVRYEAVNAMLLNEFLKEHKAFVEAQHKIEKLETTVGTLVATERAVSTNPESHPPSRNQ